MIATHSMKVNGVWYKAGEEISPANKPIVKETIREVPRKEYTKKDITFMKVDNLRTLAKENGIEGAEDMTGSALKPLLIEKLGL